MILEHYGQTRFPMHNLAFKSYLVSSIPDNMKNINQTGVEDNLHLRRLVKIHDFPTIQEEAHEEMNVEGNR